jgi:hypothetical protein
VNTKRLVVMNGGRQWLVKLPTSAASRETLMTVVNDCPFWAWIVPRTVLSTTFIYLRTDAQLAQHRDPETRKFIIECLMHKAVAELADKLLEAGVISDSQWRAHPLGPSFIPRPQTI